MKKLSKDNKQKAIEYIKKNARPLDMAVFEKHFNNGSSDNVLSELEKYQNDDGGFGNAIEPDIRSKLSSPIGTSYALQYIERLGLDDEVDLIDKALTYFDSTYKPETKQWYSISSEINDFPHAPWWTFNEEKEKSDEGWGNPTVEILGYIAKYGDISKYQEAYDKALKRINEKESIETHELQCYFRFYNLIPEADRKQIEKALFDHIDNTVESDPSKWEGYVTKPLTFVDSPNSPLYEKFSSVIELELDMVVDSQGEDGGWTPTWEWGTYPEVLGEVKVELGGMITVGSLILLDKFGRLE